MSEVVRKKGSGVLGVTVAQLALDWWICGHRRHGELVCVCLFVCEARGRTHT